MNPQLLNHIKREKLRPTPPCHWLQNAKFDIGDGVRRATPFVVISVGVAILIVKESVSFLSNSAAFFLLGVVTGSFFQTPSPAISSALGTTSIPKSVFNSVSSFITLRRARQYEENRRKISELLGSVGAPLLSNRCNLKDSSDLSKSQWRLLLKYITSQIELLNLADKTMETLRIGASLFFGKSRVLWIERVESNALRRSQGGVALPVLRRRLHQILARQLLEGGNECINPSVITLSILKSMKNRLLLLLTENVERFLCDRAFRSDVSILSKAISNASDDIAYLSAAHGIADIFEFASPELKELSDDIDSIRTALFALSEDLNATSDDYFWYSKIVELSNSIQQKISDIGKIYNMDDSSSDPVGTSSEQAVMAGDFEHNSIGGYVELTDSAKLPIPAVCDTGLENKTLVYSALTNASKPKTKKRVFRSRGNFETPDLNVIEELQLRLKTLPPVEEFPMNLEAEDVTHGVDKQHDSTENEKIETATFVMPNSNEILEELQQTLKGFLQTKSTETLYGETAAT